MKSINFILIIIACFTLSCKDEYAKDLDSVSGIWKLSKMEYQKSIRTLEIIDNSGNTVTFADKNDSTNLFGRDRSGFQIIGKDTLNFIYNFDFSINICDLSFEQSDIKTMPLDAIGRVQVYHFEIINKTTIEFYIETEYDFLNNQVLKSTSYIFTKI